jgi:signal transduction histidine kinase
MRLPLLWKIWLSTSVALAALFALIGFVIQRQILDITTRSHEEEVKAGFGAYESLWRARAEALASVSAVISSMPNVRAAFGTRDPATIQDTTAEVWSRITSAISEAAFLHVTDPGGGAIASLGPGPARSWPLVRSARTGFPKQASGFFVSHGSLYRIVLTPVYVDSTTGSFLINVLVAGFEVNHEVAERLKGATGGSEFVFMSPEGVFASTVSDPARILSNSSDYVSLVRDLVDVEGKPIGKLAILRSLESGQQRVQALHRNIALIWLAATMAGLGLSYAFTRRIVQPVRELDRAAAEVARQNYSYRVASSSDDELGRLAATFNSMCSSLQAARAELIRQERISTIGRLAGSIVHDLRNPLAAIYGGAEMMVDTDLSQSQMKRLATNIYGASRRIQEMLQELLDVCRGRGEHAEVCNVREVVGAAIESVAAIPGIAVSVDVPDVEVAVERARMERVFVNLLQNAAEAMNDDGSIRIAAATENGCVLLTFEDTGPGISPAIRERLFEPFATHGKRTGLGLGLALSRQTVLDHGGDMWVAPADGSGAKFYIRLPRAGEITAGGTAVRQASVS